MPVEIINSQTFVPRRLDQVYVGGKKRQGWMLGLQQNRVEGNSVKIKDHNAGLPRTALLNHNFAHRLPGDGYRCTPHIGILSWVGLGYTNATRRGQPLPHAFSLALIPAGGQFVARRAGPLPTAPPTARDKALIEWLAHRGFVIVSFSSCRSRRSTFTA